MRDSVPADQTGADVTVPELDTHTARELLAAAPTVPVRVDRFSSNTLFGQPGIYPDGPPMEPALGDGDPLDTDGARSLLEHLLGPAAGTAREVLDDPTVAERVPDLAVRTALALLAGGPAEPLLDAFRRGDTAVTHLGVGEPDSPGRVVGRAAGVGPEGSRVLNARYRDESPAVIAPSLAHALCHHGDRAGNAEEATLHGLLAAVHTWLIAAEPALADLGTELSRRQASLTISLLNARAPGSWRAAIRCPDGPGTIPGGDPALQGPDLWSIPFTDRDPRDCDLAVPAPVRESLTRLAPGTAPPVPDRYDERLGAWTTDHMGDGAWFGPVVRARAGVALGLLDPSRLSPRR